MNRKVTKYLEEVQHNLNNIPYYKKSEIGYMDSDCLMEEYKDGELYFIKVEDFIDRATFKYTISVLDEVIDKYTDIEIHPETFLEVFDELEDGDSFYNFIDNYLMYMNDLIDCAKILNNLEYLESDCGLWASLDDPIEAIKVMTYYSFKSVIYSEVYDYFDDISKNEDL